MSVSGSSLGPSGYIGICVYGRLMSLRARIHYPGAVYHVMQRGNGGRDVFFDESDRIRFYDLLERGVKRFDVRIAVL